MRLCLLVALFGVGCLAPELIIEEDEEPSPPPPCHSQPGDADRDRAIIVGRGFTDTGTTWSLFDLSAGGALSDPGSSFEMGRPTSTPIHFTPDGELGFAIQNDGTLGVFRLIEGDVEVLDAGFGADLFYAVDLAIEADAQRIWVVDGNWRDNGGGLHPFDLACDGTLSPAGDVLPGKQPMGLQLDDGDPSRAFVAARDLLDSAGGDNAHLVDLTTGSILGGAPVFPDDEAIVPTAYWTRDRRHALVADNSVFSGIPNRIGVVEIDGGQLIPRSAIAIEDPVGFVEAPDGSQILVLSGVDDALVILEPTGDPAEPFGVIDSFGAQLPAAVAIVERGPLAGLAFVTEVGGLRQLTLGATGAVDGGLFSSASGNDAILSAVGVQP